MKTCQEVNINDITLSYHYTYLQSLRAVTLINKDLFLAFLSIILNPDTEGYISCKYGLNSFLPVIVTFPFL